jgi:hypothetical protein
MNANMEIERVKDLPAVHVSKKGGEPIKYMIIAEGACYFCGKQSPAHVEVGDWFTVYTCQSCMNDAFEAHAKAVTA